MQPTTTAYQTAQARQESFERARIIGTSLKSRAKKNFLSWPHETPGVDEMAAAGFFFAPTKEIHDRVECFFCHQSFSQWQEDDDPALEHVKLCPNCPWANLCSKVAAEWAQSVGTDTLAGTEHDPYSTSNYEGRLGTFVNWPYEKRRGWKPKSTLLAQAGFHFVPQCHNDDTTECALCGITLNGWEPRDDPINEHRRRRPDCLFFLSAPKEVKWSANTSPKKIMRKRPSPVLEDLTQSIDITADAHGTPLVEKHSASVLVTEQEEPMQLDAQDISVSPKVCKQLELQKALEPEVEPEVKQVVESEMEPEAEPEVEPEVEPEAEPEVEQVVESEAEPEVAPEMEPEVEQEVETEVELEVAPKVATEALPEVAAQAVELAIESVSGAPEIREVSEAELEMEQETPVVPKAELEAEHIADPTTAQKDQVCPDGEVAPAHEIKRETAVETAIEVEECANPEISQLESTNVQILHASEPAAIDLAPECDPVRDQDEIDITHHSHDADVSINATHTSRIPQLESSTFYENIEDFKIIKKDVSRFSLGISGIDPALQEIGSGANDHANSSQFKPREIVDLANASHISAADFSMVAGERSIEVENSPETTLRLKRSTSVSDGNETKRARKSLTSESSEFATAPSLLEPADVSKGPDTNKADQSTAKRSFLAAWMHSTPSALKNALSPRRLFGQAKMILPSPLGGQAEAKPSPADCTFALNNPEFSMIGAQLTNDPEPVKEIEKAPELDISSSSIDTVDETLILPSLDSLLDNLGGLTSDTLSELAKRKNGLSSRQWLEMVADQVTAAMSKNTDCLVAELEKQRQLAIQAVLRR